MDGGGGVLSFAEAGDDRLGDRADTDDAEVSKASRGSAKAV